MKPLQIKLNSDWFQRKSASTFQRDKITNAVIKQKTRSLLNDIMKQLNWYKLVQRMGKERLPKQVMKMTRHRVTNGKGRSKNKYAEQW